MLQKRVLLQSFDDIQGLLVVLFWLELVIEGQPADARHIDDKCLPSCQRAKEVGLDAEALP